MSCPHGIWREEDCQQCTIENELLGQIADRERAYELLFAENAKLRKAMDAAHELAAKQAADDGLWFDAKTAPEAHLQNALRELAATILPPNAELRGRPLADGPA